MIISKMASRSSLFVLLLTLLSVIPGIAQKVKIEEKDGVVIIKNPKNPVSVPGGPTSLVCEENLKIGVEEGEEEYMFANLRSVQVDSEDNIYVLDSKYVKVKVYDKNGKHIRSFGKVGQGPGEFQSPTRMYMRSDDVIAILDTGSRRFSYYSTDGECLKEISVADKGSISRSWPDSRGYIYGETMELLSSKRTLKIVKYNPDFNIIGDIATLKEKRTMGEINPIMNRIVCFVRPDDHIVWAKTLDYCIHISNPDGKIVKKINKDFDPIPVSSEEKKKIKKERGEAGFPPSIKLVFPKNHPPIYYLISDEKGRIYVRTNEVDESGLFKWDVFDEEGRFILNFYHTGDEFFMVVKNDQIYACSPDNDEGIPYIKRYRIIWI